MAEGSQRGGGVFYQKLGVLFRCFRSTKTPHWLGKTWKKHFFQTSTSPKKVCKKMFFFSNTNKKMSFDILLANQPVFLTQVFREDDQIGCRPAKHLELALPNGAVAFRVRCTPKATENSKWKMFRGRIISDKSCLKMKRNP